MEAVSASETSVNFYETIIVSLPDRRFSALLNITQEEWQYIMKIVY
jgi:hypothetical protein